MSSGAHSTWNSVVNSLQRQFYRFHEGMIERFSLRFLSSSLFLAIMTLFGVGLVQVYSASYVFATETYGDGLYFFKRQILFSAVAISIMIVTIQIPRSWIERWAWMLWPIAIAGIAATFIPALGARAGGALRWVRLPWGFRGEPAEIAKIGFVLFLATLFVRESSQLKKMKWYFWAVMLVLPFVLLLRQPDFGSFAILVLVALTTLFCFGLNVRILIAGILAVIPAFYFLVMSVPYRRARVMAFLDPWSDPENSGFQAIQSMLSMRTGGLWGVGLGQGQGKLFFLPEAHTDFTLAVFGEEMGFIGVCVLMLIYAFVMMRCLQIAMATQSRFFRVAVMGLGSIFWLSVMINAGVVMGMLPTKGLTLPFLSYGGSSLVMMGLLFGIVLNVENSLHRENPSLRATFPLK